MAELEWWDDNTLDDRDMEDVLEYFKKHGFVYIIALEYHSHHYSKNAEEWITEHDLDFAMAIEGASTYHFAFKDPDGAALFKLTFA